MYIMRSKLFEKFDLHNIFLTKSNAFDDHVYNIIQQCVTLFINLNHFDFPLLYGIHFLKQKLIKTNIIVPRIAFEFMRIYSRERTPYSWYNG